LDIHATLGNNTRGSNNNSISILLIGESSTGFNFSLAKLTESTISTNNSRWSNKRSLCTLLGKGTVRPDLSGGSIKDNIARSRGIKLDIHATLGNNTRGSNNNSISILLIGESSTGFNFSLAKLTESTISTNNSRRSNKRALCTLLGKLTV